MDPTVETPELEGEGPELDDTGVVDGALDEGPVPPADVRVVGPPLHPTNVDPATNEIVTQSVAFRESSIA
jgi:hypothetical protein